MKIESLKYSAKSGDFAERGFKIAENYERKQKNKKSNCNN